MNGVVDLLRCGSRLHHHGGDVQDFPRQLRTISWNELFGKTPGGLGFWGNGASYLADDPHAFDVVGG